MYRILDGVMYSHLISYLSSLDIICTLYSRVTGTHVRRELFCEKYEIAIKLELLHKTSISRESRCVIQILHSVSLKGDLRELVSMTVMSLVSPESP